MIDFTQFTQPEYFRQDISIRSYDVDFRQNLKITALFNYLQEIAWEHAEKLDFGWDDLDNQGYFWALSRMEVEVTRMPQWTENLTLITFPRPADGIFAIRDFELYDSQGVRIVAATSSWLVVNVNNRRPVRIASWYTNRSFANKSALNRAAAKVTDCADQPTKTNQFVVQVGDIDMNQHVNNVRYIDWAYNSFGMDHFCHYKPLKVVVNFNAECKIDEEVKIQNFQLSPSNHIVTVERLSDAKNLCKIEFWWDKVN